MVVDALRDTMRDPGPSQIFRFEEEFGKLVGSPHAVSVSSGTSALHLALEVCGVRAGDDVIVPTFTFCASVNPIIYLGARPVFLDVDPHTWHLNPDHLDEELRHRASRGRLPRAVVLVHLYGRSADAERIGAVCRSYGVHLIEDAAEGLGAEWHGRLAGTTGAVGIYSLNNNKLLSAGGGGVLITRDENKATHARKLATQARENLPYYQHEEVGYNYRLSHVLAAVGRAQLPKLELRILARRAVFDRYAEHLGDISALSFAGELDHERNTRWLTCLLLDDRSPISGEQIRLSLERANIESRPLWKPMHQQPAYAAYERLGGQVADDLFERGLSLPSSSNLSVTDQDRVIGIMRKVFDGRLDK